MATRQRTPALSGKPAIEPPREFNLRNLQSALQNIRERFRLCELQVNALAFAQGDNQSANAISLLQQQVLQLQQQITTLQQQIGVTDTIDLVVLDAVVINTAVVPAGAGQCRPVDDGDPDSVLAAIGLTTSAAVAGQTVTIQRRGPVTVSGAAFEPGRGVYAMVGGELTQTPSYGAFAVLMGVATSSTSVWLAPAPAPTVLVAGTDAPYDNYLPASVQLVTDILAFMAQVDAAGPGLIVKTEDGFVTTRTLQSSDRITIDNPDGVLGDPQIFWEPDGTVLPPAAHVALTGAAPTALVS